MRMLLLLPAAMVCAAPAMAETRSFNLSGFDSISAAALMDVVLKQGPYSVKVEEPNGKFDDLKLEVRGSTLVATRRNNDGRRQDETPAYTVVVTAPAIKRISVAAASQLDGKKLAFKDLDISLSSASTITLSGSCDALKLNISSGAKFEGDDLKCRTARVDVSSGANARAFASQDAQANASTGGQVTFYGKPHDLKKNTSTGGSVGLF
jgi:hypothetical protein